MLYLKLLLKGPPMRKEVPGAPNGILSCLALPMLLALATFGGFPIFASRTVVVSGTFYLHKGQRDGSCEISYE